MRRVVTALGAATLVAILLAAGRGAGRAPVHRGEAPDRAALGVARDRSHPDASAAVVAATSRSLAELAPREIVVRFLDVETGRPVPDLEVALAGSRQRKLARTNEDGVAAWEGLASGWLHLRLPDPRYGTLEGHSFNLFADRPSSPVTALVERLTTLRLRFAHDDGTPVGAVLERVEAQDDTDPTPLELDRNAEEEPEHHDWLVRPGIDLRLLARCEDGYEAEAAFRCEGWPLEERTVRMSPAGPRGRARVRFEVVAAESGEPIAGAGVGYFYSFTDPRQSRNGFRWWEGVTDSEGVGILDLPTAGDGYLYAWAAGRREFRERVDLEPGLAKTFRFALERRSGPAVRGTCNRPGAKVRLENERGNWICHTELLGGEFLFDDLEPGESYVVIVCDGDDCLKAPAVPGGPPVQLRFPPLGTLALDCRDASRHVPESIDVALEREGAWGNRQDLEPEGGRFRLSVSQGAVKVSVLAEGYRKADASVYVTGDAVNEAAIALGEPLPVLDVRVVDPAGEPVPGADVSFSRRARTAETTQPRGDALELTLTRMEPMLGGRTLVLTRPDSATTSLDGWARFRPDLEEPGEIEVRVDFEGLPDGVDVDPERCRETLRVPATGRIAATLVAVPRPIVRAKSIEDPPPAGLMDRDILVEWDGRPLRLAGEVPRRWNEPVAVKVLRGGETIELTLPPTARGFRVHQAILPPPAR